MRQGKDLENIVRFLEGRLNSDPDIKIESPKYLVDKITGDKREHDVLITTNKGHHTTIISIECRDRTKPVGVPDVEAFANKCRDTGVNQGIIVSSSGFAKTAKTKALSYGIRCFGLEEVMNLSWIAPDAKVITYERKNINLACNLDPEQKPDFPLDEIAVLSPNNTSIKINTLMDMIIENINANEGSMPWEASDKEVEYNLYLSTNNWKISHTKSEKFVSLKGINVNVKYTWEQTEHSFQKKSYTDQSTGKEIASLAYAPIKIGDTQMKATMIDTQKGRSLVLTKDKY